jgi:hypothetical protein
VYQIALSAEVAERMIENLIRISEAYLQKALEFEIRCTPEAIQLGKEWRSKSQLAAADANLLQLAIQAQRG